MKLAAITSPASADDDTENTLTGKAEMAIIRRAIDALPSKQRTAFVLTKYEEMPQKQVAEIMKISVGAVEQLLLRAKHNLKTRLEKDITSP
jgi:RNA polymerase sigma-70 factor (ECF subfamily)